MIDLDLPFDLTMKPERKVTSGKGFELSFASTYAKRRLSYSYELASTAPSVAAEEVAEHGRRVDEARVLLMRSLTYRAAAAQGGVNWAGLVVLLVLVPFIGWGAFRAFRYEPRVVKNEPPTPDELRIRSIGGWLGLLAIGIIVNPLSQVAAFVQSARATLSLATWRILTTPELGSYAPGHAILILVEALCISATVAYGVVVGILFFKRRRSFPFHFTVYAIGLAVYTVADQIAAVAVMKNVETAAIGSSWTALVRAVIWAAIWVSYVRTSKRAAHTFVERPPRRRRRARSLS